MKICRFEGVCLYVKGCFYMCSGVGMGVSVVCAQRSVFCMCKM